MRKAAQFIGIVSLILSSTISYSQNLSLVKDINTGVINNSFPHYLTVFNSKVYFVASDGVAHKLYASDGTAAGTELIGPTTGNGIVYYLTSYNSKLYFTYDNGVNGLELWASDGTTAGTTMLKDIWTGALSALPRHFTLCNGKLFFQASTATRSEGLWVTDGTVGGTQMLSSVYAAPFNSTDQFLVFNNKIYFQGNAGSGYGMWESDGTTAGTQLVKSGYFGSSSGNYAVCNGKFYFTNGDAVNGNELWVSDGTASGTAVLKDIYPGFQGSEPSNFLCSNSKIYFTANDGNNGNELWISDGTAAGTQLVKDIIAGSNGSSPLNVIEYNSQVFFMASDGSSRQLYKTDGTGSGTQLVKALTGVTTVPYIYEFKDKLYLLASTGVSESVYESDGTVAGTRQIIPAVQSFNFADVNFTGFNDELYLPAFFEAKGLEFCKLSFTLTGISEASLLNDKVRIYPNPSSGLLTLEFSDKISLQKSDYYIYTSDGQRVQSGSMNNNENKKWINVSGLKAGNYLLKVTNSTYTQILKFIIIQ
ncbi:MAG: T9SS type A sorting domain-containing protein [Bacteroidales bacterium]|nr:T9SS type A sorting domain-containing protein [Bacteroidales bacterium]